MRVGNKQRRAMAMMLVRATKECEYLILLRRRV